MDTELLLNELTVNPAEAVELDTAENLAKESDKAFDWESVEDLTLENITVVQIRLGEIQFGLTLLSGTPLHQAASLDDAISFIVQQSNPNAIVTGNLLIGSDFRVFTCLPLPIAALPAVMRPWRVSKRRHLTVW